MAVACTARPMDIDAHEIYGKLDSIEDQASEDSTPDSFFYGVEDEFKRIFPEVRRGKTTKNKVIKQRDIHQSKALQQSSMKDFGSPPENFYTTGQSSTNKGIESNEIYARHEGVSSRDLIGQGNPFIPQKDATEDLYSIQDDQRKWIGHYDQFQGEKVPVAYNTQEEVLPYVDYGCPDPRWPSRVADFDAHNTAQLLYKLYATKGDDSIDTKFHTRCNEAVARDLLSRDENRIKRATRWLQWDFKVPLYARKAEALLGEALMWSIVYEIAGRHMWDVGEVLTVLSQVMDEEKATMLLSGSVKQKLWQLEQIKQLVEQYIQSS